MADPAQPHAFLSVPVKRTAESASSRSDVLSADQNGLVLGISVFTPVDHELGRAAVLRDRVLERQTELPAPVAIQLSRLGEIVQREAGLRFAFVGPISSTGYRFHNSFRLARRPRAPAHSSRRMCHNWITHSPVRHGLAPDIRLKVCRRSAQAARNSLDGAGLVGNYPTATSMSRSSFVTIARYRMATLSGTIGRFVPFPHLRDKSAAESYQRPAGSDGGIPGRRRFGDASHVTALPGGTA